MRKNRLIASVYDRRTAVKLGAGTAAAAGIALLAPSSARAAMPERTLSFYHLHTGEKLKTTYWADGSHIPDALADINHILRDFRTTETWPIDPRLLDLLHRVQESLGTDEPYHVISGYRSPATNTKLANRSAKVARRSLHLAGQAIDVRLPGRPLRKLHKAAVAHKSGGVGYYPKSNFIHMDVGRVRYW